MSKTMPHRLHLGKVVFAMVAGCAVLTGLAVAAPVEMRAARVIHCENVDDQRPTVVTGVAITRDGHTIAAATDEHGVLVWDAATGELKAHLEGHDDWVHSVVLSPDGSTLASGGGDRMLMLWNVAQQKRLFEICACEKTVAAVCLHPNNQQLAVVGFSKKLEIINSSTGQATQELDCPCVDIRTIAFSPDGERMAAAGRNGRIRIWNVADGSSQSDIETDHRRIRSLAFSPDGRWLAAAGSGQTVHVIDCSSGQSIMQLTTRPAKDYAVVFLDNRRLATGGSDNRITIWDLNSQRVTTQLVGHTGTVAALACDEGGTVLVSGSYDTTIRIWNLVGGKSPSVAQAVTETAR